MGVDECAGECVCACAYTWMWSATEKRRNDMHFEYFYWMKRHRRCCQCCRSNVFQTWNNVYCSSVTCVPCPSILILCTLRIYVCEGTRINKYATNEQKNKCMEMSFPRSRRCCGLSLFRWCAQCHIQYTASRWYHSKQNIVFVDIYTYMLFIVRCSYNLKLLL